MSYRKDVVKSVKIKGKKDRYSDSVPIGVEQKYVTPLLNSNVNNLEEQTLLGCDCITVEWTEDNISYVTKKFYNVLTPPEKGYYILFITDYSHDEISQRLRDVISYGENSGYKNVLVFDPYYTQMYGQVLEGIEIADNNYIFESPISGAEVDGNELTLDNTITVGYDYNFTEEYVEICPDQVLARKELLCFRTEIDNEEDTQIESDILIAMKSVTQKLEGSKRINTETIINYLKEN